MTGFELHPDQKGQAALTFSEVIRSTRTNFPDVRFQPQSYLETEYYNIAGIDTHGYPVAPPNSDGIGTKPELAERLVENSRPMFGGEPQRYDHFESLAFDTFAMIDGDAYRFGFFLLGITQVIDVNRANPEMISALARGTKRACDEGRFALLGGETAELGYRTSGYGSNRVNWNATGLSIINPEKLITGRAVEPNQPLVALQELGIRSNGLSLARKILEADYLYQLHAPPKKEYLLGKIYDHFINMELTSENDELDIDDTLGTLGDLMGHDFTEQSLIPWHDGLSSQVIHQLLQPSTLYGRLIYAALGGVDGEKLIDITGAAHITGGGVPEKAKRMLKINGLGADISGVFPDPLAIRSLFHIARALPEETADNLLTERVASENWNRGIGFLIATASQDDAKRLVELAADMGYQAAIAGKVIDQRAIRFKGHTWNY